MLIRATVENYKSFDEREEFSMIASTKVDETEKYKNHCLRVGGVNLLKTASVYGANSSGKSNLISVFSFIQYALAYREKSERDKFNRNEDYCRNKPENAGRDSLFDIQFTIGEEIFEYGFTAVLSLWKITKEWLYKLAPDGKRRIIFERMGDEAPEIGDAAMPDEGSQNSNRFKTYVSDFEDNHTTLFLAEMGRNDHIALDPKLSIFKRVYDWIMKNIYVITPNVGVANREIFYKEKHMDNISDMMRSFDTGITDVEKAVVPEKDWNNIIDESELCERFDQLKKEPGSQMMIRGGNKLFILRYDKGRQVMEKLVFKHEQTETGFDFSDESDGTRRLFDLLDILVTDRPDTVFLVDELERSFHPKLTEHFIRMFMDIHRDTNTQLIIATHENTIMNTRIFRRDEIWFVEKNKDNVSKIYPLDLFTDKYDDDLGKLYLEGRYGAVPILD